MFVHWALYEASVLQCLAASMLVGHDADPHAWMARLEGQESRLARRIMTIHADINSRKREIDANEHGSIGLLAEESRGRARQSVDAAAPKQTERTVKACQEHHRQLTGTSTPCASHAPTTPQHGLFRTLLPVLLRRPRGPCPLAGATGVQRPQPSGFAGGGGTAAPARRPAGGPRRRRRAPRDYHGQRRDCGNGGGAHKRRQQGESPRLACWSALRCRLPVAPRNLPLPTSCHRASPKCAAHAPEPAASSALRARAAAR